ncbi:NUDIX domain-containing protein, partial [Pseudonocardia sp.]
MLGGAREAGGSAERAAVREAEEEGGLHPSCVHDPRIVPRRSRRSGVHHG